MLRLRTLIILFAFACALALPALAGAAAKRSTRVAHAEAGASVARYAKRFLGVPYRWGGMSPRGGFDCSGFVAYVYRHFGVSLPHYTVSQFHRGRRVGRWALRPGDFVFFGGLSHVGLYVGHGRFVHAPHSGTRVKVDSLRRGWYRSSFDGGRRLSVAGSHRSTHDRRSKH